MEDLHLVVIEKGLGFEATISTSIVTVGVNASNPSDVLNKAAQLLSMCYSAREQIIQQMKAATELGKLVLVKDDDVQDPSNN